MAIFGYSYSCMLIIKTIREFESEKGTLIFIFLLKCVPSITKNSKTLLCGLISMRDNKLECKLIQYF